MHNTKYWINKLIGKIKRNEKNQITKYFRNAGMKIGEGCTICCNIMTTEPFLITIGDNTTISGDVILITHDNSISKVNKNLPNLFGKINIGNNCFIGQRSTIMYGVTLADDIIVAAGSVVTKSFFQRGIIIGGNPARMLTTWDEFLQKHGEKAMSRKDIIPAYKNNSDKIIEQR